MIIYSSHKFAEHTPPPGHPERPERADVFDAVAADFTEAGGEVREPRLATRDELARVHTTAHLDLIGRTAGQGVMIDDDTFTSPETHEIALLAAGAAIEAARHAYRTGDPAMAMVRPPGHHAEPDRAMGFCLYNNIAVAAAALRADGAARVAIVDIDVHHGNGTQAVFYADPSVLFISSHQHPYYPGTGAAHETGAGPGVGATLNVPLAAGTTDAEYEAAYRSVVLPALERFRPEAILVSAGFDAHERDPLAGMRMTTAGYRRLIEMLDAVATRLCGRRIALITEGGYHLDALRECLDEAVKTLSAGPRRD
jgi:acetoin utilization deacetylase AcuC-like enzyme